MNPEHDALALRCAQLEQRMRAKEQATANVYLFTWALVGLVFAAIVVGAVELRAIHKLVEAQQWRSR